VEASDAPRTSLHCVAVAIISGLLILFFLLRFVRFFAFLLRVVTITALLALITCLFFLFFLFFCFCFTLSFRLLLLFFQLYFGLFLSARRDGNCFGLAF
jgi:hypothetical protein